MILLLQALEFRLILAACILRFDRHFKLSSGLSR